MTTTLEFVIHSDSIDALLAEGDRYVRSLVSPDKPARFSSVVIIDVGDKGLSTESSRTSSPVPTAPTTTTSTIGAE